MARAFPAKVAPVLRFGNATKQTPGAVGGSRAIVVAAPRSGSGKTTVTLGLLAALRQAGHVVAPAKTGPDYIDPSFLARAAGRDCVNLDPWSMAAVRLKNLAAVQATGAELLLVEGVMGLFDGATDNTGSTADLAQLLDVPVLLVVDAERQSQSVAALVSGFAHWRQGLHMGGVVLNRVASMRHERMLVEALAATGLPLLGAIPREAGLSLPERHLGLVLPGEIETFDTFLAAAAHAMASYVDLPRLMSMATPLAPPCAPPRPLPPLGQRMAIAKDEAFAFLYPHLLDDWRAQGAELSFFSPLQDEAPSDSADAIFLPGGYPELHGSRLAAAARFKSGLIAARDRGALLYGECGGFMVLGETLVDKEGRGHAMAGLLPVTTRIDRPKRILGYRRLIQSGDLPWPGHLNGHEFHYSSARQTRLTPLFAATDAAGEAQPPMGAVIGRVMGSYAHVVDAA